MIDLDFNLAQWLWLLVSLQLLLFGMGWFTGAFALKQFRPPMAKLALFNAANGAALYLVALRGQISPHLSDTLADLLVLGGFLMLWRGTAELVLTRANASSPLKPRRFDNVIEPALIGVLGGIAIILAGSVFPDSRLRVSSLMLSIALICARGGWVCFKMLRSNGFGTTARLFLATGVTIATILTMHTINGIFAQAEISFEQDSMTTIMLAFALITGIFTVNLLLAFTVTGKIMSELRRLSRQDPLTGLPNRRAMMEVLQWKWRKFVSDGNALAVLLIDVDRFKQINDTYGHAVGDQVLCAIAERMGQHVRKQDLLARSGGEEFVGIFPGTTIEQLQDIAERLRRDVEQATDIHPEPGSHVSISIGLASACEQDGKIDTLLARADDAMYQAKQSGRNRVVVADHPFTHQPAAAGTTG